MTGRDRRLQYEWQKIEQGLNGRNDIRYRVIRTNAGGLPTAYRIEYRIEHLGETNVSNRPIMADRFTMLIELPDQYPCVDGQPVFRFLTQDDEGKPIPHPWHPNIRYFGTFAGRVCLNRDDTYTDLIWGILRVKSYLTYERYHAMNTPPYPEDQQVAAWVIRQAEPNGWIPLDNGKWLTVNGKLIIDSNEETDF